MNTKLFNVQLLSSAESYHSQATCTQKS